MELTKRIIALRDEYKFRKKAALELPSEDNAMFFSGGEAACNRLLLIAVFHLKESQKKIQKSYGMTEHE